MPAESLPWTSRRAEACVDRPSSADTLCSRNELLSFVWFFQIHTGPGHGLIRTFSMSLHARGPRKVSFRLSSSPSCSFFCCFSFSLPSLCDSFSPSLSFDSLDLFKSRSLGKSLREMTSMPEVRQLTRSPFDVNDENGKRGRFRRPPAQ